MKIKKHHISGYLKLLISIACIIGILLLGWFAKKDLQPSPTPLPQPAQTQHKNSKNKKKASKPSSAEPTHKKRSNKKRPVSATRRKKAEIEAAERKAALECLLHEDSLN